ncbi:MAG: T9SS type A sorting domain-containing protein [Flavobacteriia bacterium]
MNGQIAFYKLYSNNGYDAGEGAVQLEDSSFVICGSSSSFTDGPSQAFMLHVDSVGNYLWSNHYGGPELESARRVLYIKNIGYYLAGFTNSFGNGAYDFYLVKTDLQGELIWQKTYGGTEWEKVHDAALTKDTGAIMVGETNSTNGNATDAFIVRTNSGGDTLWTKTFGGLGIDLATSIRSINDSTFVIGGQIYLQDSLKTKGFLMRIRDNGSIDWFKTLGDNGNYSISDVDVYQNKINYVGYYLNNQTQIESPFFGRMDASGIPDFTGQETVSDKRVRDLITTFGSEGKKYMAYRYTADPSSNFGLDLTIARLPMDLWWDNSYVTVNFPYEDLANQLIPTSDGGVVAVGTTLFSGAGGSNVFVLKIGPNSLYPTVPVDPTPNSLVFVNQLNAFSKIAIYPNPSNGNIKIMSEDVTISSAKLIDLSGKLILVQHITKGSELDLTQFQTGTYMLELFNDRNESLGRTRVVLAN